MKSMQVLFVCAFVVICTANPLPDEAVVPTSAPVAETSTPEQAKSIEVPVPGVKLAEIPAVNTPNTDIPSVKSEEKIPEPQALPSKTDESSTTKSEEKKREIQEPLVAATESAPVKPVEQAKSVQPTEVIKNEQPAQHVEAVTSKALEPVSQVSGQVSQGELKSTENVKSLAPESIQPAQESVQSTVVPAGISSEKKIDAEAPAPIVSENVQVPAEPELKSIPAVPVVAALSIEPTAKPSIESASSSEKKPSNESEQDSSSEDSSEESKESDDKKSA